VTRARDALAILLENRAQGRRFEAWAAAFLRRIHAHVRIVGSIHAGSAPSQHAPAGEGFDIIADGLHYEVKTCCEHVRRSNVRSGRQHGRWKIDRDAHDGLDPDRASRTLYLLIVRRKARVLRAYLVSHAVMTRIIRAHKTTSRHVTLPHHMITQDLVLVHGEPP